MEDDSTIDLCTIDKEENADDYSNEKNGSEDQDVPGHAEDSSYGPAHELLCVIIDGCKGKQASVTPN